MKECIDFYCDNTISIHASYSMLHSTKENFDDFIKMSSTSNSTNASELYEDFHACNLKTIFNALTSKGDSKVHSTFDASAMNVKITLLSLKLLQTFTIHNNNHQN